MIKQSLTLGAMALALALGGLSPAQALTMAECSAKYQAAKDANTLKGMKWNDFRKAECAAADAPADAAKAEPVKADTAKTDTAKTDTAKTDTAKTDTAKTDTKKTDTKKTDAKKPDPVEVADPVDDPNAAEPDAPTMVAPKGVTFPKAIDKKYASESPGKGRMHTCVDAYHVNKDANTLAGLKWIQKGGGYYSLCNKKLKGEG